MTIEGELAGVQPVIECSDCGGKMPFGIQSSAAGYYLGYWCDMCGPLVQRDGLLQDPGRRSGHCQGPRPVEPPVRMPTF